MCVLCVCWEREISVIPLMGDSKYWILHFIEVAYSDTLHVFGVQVGGLACKVRRRASGVLPRGICHVASNVEGQASSLSRLLSPKSMDDAGDISEWLGKATGLVDLSLGETWPGACKKNHNEAPYIILIAATELPSSECRHPLLVFSFQSGPGNDSLDR